MLGVSILEFYLEKTFLKGVSSIRPNHAVAVLAAVSIRPVRLQSHASLARTAAPRRTRRSTWRPPRLAHPTASHSNIAVSCAAFQERVRAACRAAFHKPSARPYIASWSLGKSTRSCCTRLCCNDGRHSRLRGTPQAAVPRLAGHSAPPPCPLVDCILRHTRNPE